MRYAPSMRASGLSFLLKRVLLSHKDIGRKGLSAYSRNFCNRCQKEEMKRNLEKSLEKIKMHWLLTQRNKQKFLFPRSLPKCSPHREEEAAALWAPKGGQTPALRKSWPRGPLFDGSWYVFCFGKLCQVPGLGSSDLLKSQVTLCQGMYRSLGIPGRLMSSIHPDTLNSLSLAELHSYGEELVRFLFVLQASKPGEVRTTTGPKAASWDLNSWPHFQ